MTNAGGATVWYTDAFGHGARTEPFDHSIRQRIASVNSEIGVDFDEMFIGADRDYAGPGVRSPN